MKLYGLWPENIRPTRAEMRKIGVALLLLYFVAAGDGSGGNADSCPMDLNYVHKMPWNNSSCQTFLQSDPKGCCSTLVMLLGAGLAQYLKEKSMFELPDNASAVACFGSFQQQLKSAGLPTEWVPACFKDPTPYISSPRLCFGIQTQRDWHRLLGKTALDTSCRGDLSIPAACSKCRNAGEAVSDKLRSLDANATSEVVQKCFYFACLYAAGLANEFGPLNANTVSCTFTLSMASSGHSSGREHSRHLLYVSLGAASLLLLLGVFGIAYRRLWARKDNRGSVKSSRTRLGGTALRPDTGTTWFDIEEIKEATDGFSQANLVGHGGFGTVYRGSLRDGRRIAVKKIRNCSSEGDSEFLNEVHIINNIRHRNLVVLKGCSVASDEAEGHERFLVYEYMPNGSLEDRLFGPKMPPLTWPQRQNIALGTARGLSYLHYGVQPAIIHRDIKPSNILLDERLNARVADFGLAKMTTEGESHVITRIAGTHGYLAPEYALYGHLTAKNDVYSFGVVLLEIISGRRALDASVELPSDYLITDWAWTLVKEGRTAEVVDARIRHGGPRGIMERFVLVGILCAHVMVAFRPTIVEALQMLEGELEIPEIPARPLPLTDESIGHGSGSFIISTSFSDPSMSSASTAPV